MLICRGYFLPRGAILRGGIATSWFWLSVIRGRNLTVGILCLILYFLPPPGTVNLTLANLSEIISKKRVKSEIYQSVGSMKGKVIGRLEFRVVNWSCRTSWWDCCLHPLIMIIWQTDTWVLRIQNSIPTSHFSSLCVVVVVHVSHLFSRLCAKPVTAIIVKFD